MRLLLADDDLTLCELLQEFLQLEGFEVTVVHDGNAAADRINDESARWDIIILDVMMPGRNGFDVLKATDGKRTAPVLMLTARGEDTDTVLGLELGADEYVAKPVSPRVLLARIRALLRHNRGADRSGLLTQGDLVLDAAAREVHIDNHLVELTGAEFNLLKVLVQNAGKVVSREELALDGLGRALTAYDRRIETHMTQIRRKIGNLRNGRPRIKTVRGVGYQYIVSA